MGSVFLVVATLALAGEPAAEFVRVEVRMVATDGLTGEGKVLTEPTILTLAGHPATLRSGGGSKVVTGEDGTERPVQLGLTVEVTPVVRRTAAGAVVEVTCVVRHTISSPDGVVTRTVRKQPSLQPGERQVIRLAGEGHFAPVAVVVTAWPGVFPSESR